MKKKEQKNNLYFDYDLIFELSDMGCLSIEELMTALDVDYRRNGKMLVGTCPIHGGDNPSAWNFYPEGEDMRGFWKCRTHHCEKKQNSNGKVLYGPTLAGFIRGVLSFRNNRYVSYQDSVDWLVKFLGYNSLDEIQRPSPEASERRQYAASLRRINLVPKQSDTGWSRAKLRSTIQIPASYYLERGYSQKILDKYDVGLYNKENRAVVPVYDDKYHAVAGFLGRSIFKQCNKCKLWHSPESQCPSTDIQVKKAAKWLNSDGFETANYLYNYWFALEHIRSSTVAALVEGAGDVWRLEENNISIGLGIFGTELTEQQRVLLDRSGALSLIVLLDPDKAGQEGAKKLKKQLGRQYRMFFPKIRDDVGGLHDDEITSEIQPIIEKVMI